MRLAARLISIGMRKGASSASALLFFLFSNLISLTIFYFLWRAILTGSRAAEFGPTFTYLVIMQLIGTVVPKTSYDISDDVSSGDVIFKALKPIGLVRLYFFEALGYSLVKLLIVGGFDLFILLLVWRTPVTLSGVLLFLLALGLGYVLYFELELIIGTFSFFTYSIWGLNTFKAAILLIFAGNLFPLNYYPAIIREIGQFLPFQYAFGEIITPLYRSAADGLRVVLIQLLYIGLLYRLYVGLYRRGINKLVVQGG